MKRYLLIMACLLLSLMAGCSEDTKKDEVKVDKASTEKERDDGGESTKNGQIELKTAPEPVVEQTVEEEPSESYAIGVKSMTQHVFLKTYNNLAIVLDTPTLLEQATIEESTKDIFTLSMTDSIKIVGDKDTDGNVDRLTIWCYPDDSKEFDGDCELSVSALLMFFMPELDMPERLGLVVNTLGMTEMRNNGVEEIRDITHDKYRMGAWWKEEEGIMLFSIMHKDNPKYQ
jgi:hypothetical protein